MRRKRKWRSRSRDREETSDPAYPRLFARSSFSFEFSFSLDSSRSRRPDGEDTARKRRSKATAGDSPVRDIDRPVHVGRSNVHAYHPGTIIDTIRCHRAVLSGADQHAACASVTRFARYLTNFTIDTHMCRYHTLARNARVVEADVAEIGGVGATKGAMALAFLDLRFGSRSRFRARGRSSRRSRLASLFVISIPVHTRASWRRYGIAAALEKRHVCTVLVSSWSF